jgi:ribose-phosphate pyrophosphokinase
MAKSRTHLISNIPHANCGNRVVMLDLHTEGLPYYYDASVRTVHLYAKPVIMAIARRLGGERFVLASTDAGRAKWVESLANDMQVSAAFVYKRRIDGSRTEIAGISAEVREQTVVIYDDMIRTGGSLLQAAKAYRAAGAREVFAVATHGLFPGDSLEIIRKSGLLAGVVTTDSHPRAIELGGDFLQIESIAELLGNYLRDSLYS